MRFTVLFEKNIIVKLLVLVRILLNANGSAIIKVYYNCYPSKNSLKCTVNCFAKVYCLVLLQKSGCWQTATSVHG